MFQPVSVMLLIHEAVPYILNMIVVIMCVINVHRISTVIRLRYEERSANYEEKKLAVRHCIAAKKNNKDRSFSLY